MNSETHRTLTPRNRQITESPADDSLDLASYAWVLIVWRRLLVVCGVLAVVIAVLVTLASRKVYESKATLLASKESQGAPGFSIALSQMAQQVGGLPLSFSNPNRDLILSVLKSRGLRESIARAFADRQCFEGKDLPQATRKLEAMARISVNKEGVISIVVRDHDPETARDLANGFVDHLQTRLHEITRNDASSQVTFLEQRLSETLGDLEGAENALKAFQERHRILSMEETAKGSALFVRELRAIVADLEARVEVYRSDYASGSRELRYLEGLLAERRKQLEELQGSVDRVHEVERISSPLQTPGDAALAEGAVGSGASTGSKISPEEDHGELAVSELPGIYLELGRLRRKAVLENKIYLLLVEEYERAQISRARGAPELRKLDIAVAATSPSSPRLVVNVFLAASLAAVLAALLAIALEYCHRWGFAERWPAWLRKLRTAMRPRSGADSGKAADSETTTIAQPAVTPQPEPDYEATR